MRMETYMFHTVETENKGGIDDITELPHQSGLLPSDKWLYEKNEQSNRLNPCSLGSLQKAAKCKLNGFQTLENDKPFKKWH